MSVSYIVVPELQKTEPERETSKRRLLKTIKRGIKTILTMGKVRSRIFVPVLYASPAEFQMVVVHLVNAPSSRQPAWLYVNGRKMERPCWLQAGRDLYASCPSDYFNTWENVVALPPDCPVVQVQLYPRVEQGREAEAFRLMTTRFSCECRSVSDGDYRSIVHPAKGATGIVFRDDADLIEAQTAGACYLLNTFNVEKGSPFRHTFQTAYDLDDRAFRNHSWVWTSAAVVRALIGHQRKNPSNARAKQLLSSVGDYFIRNQVRGGANDGAFMVRWDLWPQSRQGIVPWLAPNDAAYIGANALLPFYELSRDQSYLNAAIKLANWIIGSGTTSTGLVYVGYRLDEDCWDRSWLYVDSAFTVPFFEALYLLEPAMRYRQWAKKFLDRFLSDFALADGCFAAIIPNKVKGKEYIFTRGQGWALDGLISGYRLLDDSRYLSAALRLAAVLRQTQNPNGSWHYNLYDPASGEDAKAVAVIAFHLLQLFEITNDRLLHDSSIMALDWCCKHQIVDGDDFAVGGIASHTIEGAIAGKRDASVIFSYTVAYYMMAVEKLVMMGSLP